MAGLRAVMLSDQKALDEVELVDPWNNDQPSDDRKAKQKRDLIFVGSCSMQRANPSAEATRADNGFKIDAVFLGLNWLDVRWGYLVNQATIFHIPSRELYTKRPSPPMPTIKNIQPYTWRKVASRIAFQSFCLFRSAVKVSLIV